MNAPYRSPHLRNKPPMNIKSKPGGAMGKPGMPSKGEHEEPASEHGDMKHMSETHGTSPHPKTGVHGVMTAHMGGGKAMTHTHHDGGHIETKEHPDMASAHQQAQSDLPEQNSEMAEHGEPDGDEMPIMEGMGGLGGDE